ncbi:diphosphomevalonate decarboxylase isoform X2 [Photinus pyralis]|nr:diphosphomevalonate decarboxylase isoform X2 [Photinus pyralis]
MRAKTTVMASPTFKENKIWLNGKEESFENPRLQHCMKELKQRARKNTDVVNWNIHVCSENNFPTAAGLASSAAGYACFVYAIAQLYGVEGDITAIARRGSGSACRSIYGGWVQWHVGKSDDGSDSFATQIAGVSHWPEMRILTLVVNSSRKKCSSTDGMRRSIATSSLLKYRVDHVVKDRVEGIIRAIKEKDFKAFAEITMKDSNQFHAICSDTYPPLSYVNEVSRRIIELIHAYNELRGTTKVAYTFDAGPNACLYLLEEDVPEVVALIQYVFPSDTERVEYFKGLPINPGSLSDELKVKIDIPKQKPGSIKYIIYTDVGEGARVLNDDNEHLLNDCGNPKRLN